MSATAATARAPEPVEDSWPQPDPSRPGAWAVPPDPDCAVGGRLFDPRHGVVLVERFESRQRGGEVTEYLSLRVVDQELLVLVPRTAMAAGPARCEG